MLRECAQKTFTARDVFDQKTWRPLLYTTWTKAVPLRKKPQNLCS